MAKELATDHEVTLVAPNEPELAVDGIKQVAAGSFVKDRWDDAAMRFDAVVARRLSVTTMRSLAGKPVRVIYDLYNPALTENLAFYGAAPGGGGRAVELSFRGTNLRQQIALATGDSFICASERQRDLWLGHLGALGRLDILGYASDPSYRSLIDVVPFGLDPQPAAPGAPVLKGVMPGIEPDDKVLLWGGGIWNWLDPLTVIRAVGELAKRRRDVKLVFLGLRHPSPELPEMGMADRAVALARELGLESRFVVFKEGWVPYEERDRYFLEADLGVSAHFDTIETRFAFRTRLLDHFRAGLPTIATEGDVLSEVVLQEELGRTVGFQDVDGWVKAIEGLLEARAELERARANSLRVALRYAWPVVIQPLRRLLEHPSLEAPAPRVEPLIGRYAWLGFRGAVGEKGAAAAVRQALGVARRSELP